MSVDQGATVVFGYLTNLVTVFGMLTWINILLSHIAFRRACTAQGVPTTDLAYRAPCGIVGSVLALVFLSLLILTKGIDVFIPTFNYKNFIVQYIGIPVYIILIFGYKFMYKTKMVLPKTADLWTGTLVFREEERQQLEKDARENKGVYERFVSWLF
jgi:yeast amino acid transporter